MIILKLLSRLPLAILYAISNLIYFTAFYLVGYRKKVVYKNLKAAFPEKNEEEINAIAKKFYQRLADFMVETIKAISISPEALNRRVRFVNVEVLQPYRNQHQSVLVLASHHFNWEWGLLAGCLQLPFPVDAMYQKLSNRSFDRLMFEIRSRFEGKPLEKEQAFREIVKNKDRLKALGVVADQSPTKAAAKYWTEFLHQPTAFYVGAQQIARLGNYPVFYMAVKFAKRGHYSVELSLLTTPPYSKDQFPVIEAYAKATEKAINEDPSGWLWSHRRWKLSPDNDKLPSNPNQHFNE